MESQIFIIGMILALGGAFSAIATGFGDMVHYMNRDIDSWVYACEGFILGLVLSAYIFQMCATRFV